MSTLGEMIRPPRLEEILPELSEQTADARDRNHVPLFVQIPVALGLTVASAFLCGGFALISRDEALVGATGAMIGLVSIIVSWLPLPWFARPLVQIGALLSRLMIVFALWDHRFVAMPLVELAILLLHRDSFNRIFSAMALPAWLLYEYQLYAFAATLGSLLGGGGLVVLRRFWLHWPAPLRELAAAVATGLLGLALALPCVPGPAWSPAFGIGVGLATAALGGAIALRAGIGLPSTAAAVLVPLALAAFTVPVPGVPVAMLVAFTGFVARSPRLWVSACVAMVSYGVYFYYDLDWGLAAKGGAMLGAGAVLILAGLLAGRHRDQPRPERPAPAEPLARGARRLERIAIALGVGLALATIAGTVLYQEAELARSRIVYLPLAPVDPRSLVQGDYMALRFDIEVKIRSGSQWGDSGTAILRVDERDIASFARLDDGSELAPDELAIDFFHTPRGPAVAARAYLFQEGTAREYQPARYGMIAVTPEGRGALVGLADSDLERLGPAPRRW